MKTVLTAEDNPTNRELLRELPEMRGYAVTESCNGEEALAMVEQTPLHTAAAYWHASTRRLCSRAHPFGKICASLRCRLGHLAWSVCQRVRSQ